jgi:hypothetical protein
LITCIRIWLAAGQALEPFLNQAVEIADLRPRFIALLGHSDLLQIVLRLGYGDNVMPTPRRPLEKVLIV